MSSGASRRYAIAASFILLFLVDAWISANHALRAQSPSAPVGDALVDIGGRRLHVSCSGSGSPTVMLEAGLGDPLTTWKAVQPTVAGFTRVCSYDRANRGTSDPDPARGLRTSQTIVEDLNRLLRAAPITGPYVLVGHSLGGAHIRLYASRFPQGIAGMVLVDSSHEDQIARFKATGYSPPVSQNSERVDMEASLVEVGLARWRGDVPLVVLSHGQKIAGQAPNITQEQADRIEIAWLDMQRDLAGRSPQGRLVVAERSGHYVHVDEPDRVIQAIREVVTAARTAARR